MESSKSLEKFIRLSLKGSLSNLNVLGRSALSSPYKITYAVTYKCNSRCKTCGIWKKKSVGELTGVEIGKFSKKTGFNWVNLTGGEPFVRRDFYDIVRTMERNWKDIYIFNTTTNGFLPSLISKTSERIARLGMPSTVIVVSIDGTRHLHESNRGVKGCWDRAIETFETLKGLESRYGNFQTHIGYTISPMNIGRFGETLDALRERLPWIGPKDMHLNLFHSSEHYYGNTGSNGRRKALNERALIKEIRTISEMKGGRKLLPVPAIDFLEDRYLRYMERFVRQRRMPLPCKAMSASIFMDPYGNVFPCTIFNRPLGNIRDNGYDVKALLKSAAAKEALADVKGGRCPHCWTPCEAYPAMVGNILKAYRSK